MRGAATFPESDGHGTSWEGGGETWPMATLPIANPAHAERMLASRFIDGCSIPHESLTNFKQPP